LSETALNREVPSRVESTFAAVRGRLRTDGDEAALAVRVVYAGVAAYAALFVFAALVHYFAFGEARFDLGNMTQAIWNTLHGHFLESTTLNGNQRDRLGFHVDPFLLVLAPLYWIWSSPALLLVAQVLGVASGALPVFWLARKHLDSSRAGAHFAFAYLIYPATQFNAFTVGDGFHPISLAVPLVLYAVWFLDEDRLVACSATALLAFTTKEEIPLAVGCLGIWYAVRRGRRLFGLSFFALGLGVTLFNLLWVIPHFSWDGGNPFASRYTAVGGTPRGVVHKLFSDPVAFLHAVASGHKLLYVILLLVPFLGLWLLEPLLFLGALPELAIDLLSSKPDQTLIAYQYTAGIVPFVVAASIFGARRFRHNAAGLSLVALAGAGAASLFSPLNLLAHDVRALGSPVAAAKSHALGLIPERLPVASSNQLGAYLSNRRYTYEFPHVRQSQWIVVDIHDPTEKARFRDSVRRYESDSSWRVVFSSNGIVVLRKRPATGP